MEDWDVIVAGAGPGGAALANALGKDARVLVLDRARFPREKPCGGGLTGHAAEALAAAGLELTVAQTPSPRARVRFGGFERLVDLPRPVRVIRREEFDHSLVQQARARGATVREGEAVSGFEVDDAGVSVTTTRGRLRAKILVGADGAGSIVRKRLIPSRDPVPIRLHRAEIDAPPSWRGRDEMVYDFSPMRDGLRGYLWVFPVPGDRLNVGVMHYPGSGARLGGADLVRLLRDGLARHGITYADHGRGWLSLVLFDPDVLSLYAARVSGGLILADQKLRLFRALFRHLTKWPTRRRELHAAASG